MEKGNQVSEDKGFGIRGLRLLPYLLLALVIFIPSCVITKVAVVSLPDLPANAVHPVWSPDGETLVFESDLKGNWDIWTVKRDGSDLTQLTDGVDSERFASWSPDGTRLTYSSDEGGNWDIWAMSADGSNPIRLTTYKGLDIAPVWSPNGKQIAFVSSRTMDVLVWIMDQNGENIIGMPNIRCGDWVSAWSPDGKSVAAVSSMRGRSDIWLINTEKRTIEQLTQKTETRRDFLPAFSPDGKQIAFISERDGKRDIWLMDLDGNNERRLTRGALGPHEMKYNVDREVFDGLSFLYLSWSPDGRELAFTHVNKAGRGEIAVLRVSS